MSTKRRPAHSGVDETRATDQSGAKLPEGYEDVALDAASVDWKEEKMIEGRVIGGDTLNTENGARRVLFVLTAGGPRMLWENAQLRRMFDSASVGEDIYVRAVGFMELDNGRKMRTFKVGRKPAKAGARPVFQPRARAAAGAAGGSDDIPF